MIPRETKGEDPPAKIFIDGPFSYDLIDEKTKFSALIYGCRGSGKTMLVLDIIKNIGHRYDNIIVFSDAEYIEHAYSHMKLTVKSLSHDEIRDVCGLPGKTLTVFDSVIYTCKTLRESLQKLLRVTNVSTIFTCQYLLDIPPVLRSDIMFSFYIGKFSQPDVKKILCYINRQPFDLKFQYEQFMELTRDFKCIVYVKKGDGQVYSHKATFTK